MYKISHIGSLDKCHTSALIIATQLRDNFRRTMHDGDTFFLLLCLGKECSDIQVRVLNALVT